MLFILLALPVSGKVIVKYIGESPNCKDEIRKQAASSATSDLQVIAIQEILSQSGYFDAVVEFEGDTLQLDAGGFYRIRTVTVVGDTSVVFSMQAPLVSTVWEKMASGFLQPYLDAGYYYAKLTPTNITGDRANSSVTLAFDKGPKLTAEGYSLAGLTRSRPSKVERFLPAIAGRYVTRQLMTDIAAAARRIEHLTFESGPEVRPSPGFLSGRLGLRFKEKKPAFFEGGLGYQADESEEFIWSLHLSLINLFGEGRQAEILSARPDKGRTTLDIRYRQPLFLLGGGYVGVRASTRDYRDLFYEFAASTEYEWRLNTELEGAVLLGWKNVTPAGIDPAYSRSSLRLSLSRSTLNTRPEPDRGTRVEWDVAYYYRNIEAGELEGAKRFNDTQTRLELERLQSLFSRFGQRMRISYETIISDDQNLPLSELILVGGPGSLRGFRNEQFAVTTAITASLEPYIRFTGGRISLFYDAAYLMPLSEAGGTNDQTDEFYRFGFGFGFDFVGIDRSLKLSLGWSRDLPFDQPRLSVQVRSNI